VIKKNQDRKQHKHGVTTSAFLQLGFSGSKTLALAEECNDTKMRSIYFYTLFSRIFCCDKYFKKNLYACAQ
jgi:hypothetical protein